MDIMSFIEARSAVALYNEHRCARAVVRQLKVPYQSVFDLACWLWDYAYPRENDLVSSRPVKQLLPDLTKETWLEYLYTRNVSAEAAAESVKWAPEEVSRTCHGPRQWARSKNRRPMQRKKPCQPKVEPREADITEEEIYRRAAEIRKERPDTPVQQRVEIQRYSFSR